MIEKTIERWHAHLRGELAGGLDELLAEDCVFLSPVVFTPQRGRAITKMYLNAAGSTFSGDREPGRPVTAAKLDSGGFRYVRETFGGNSAVLEFETTLDGKYINGVDIITCNDAGEIVEFKVMVRPLQAVNLLHERMAAMLEAMKAGR